MTADELDAQLDEPCPSCHRRYRWCECEIDTRIDPGLPADEMALDVSATWMSRRTTYDTASGLRIWARYRRNQGGAP